MNYKLVLLSIILLLPLVMFLKATPLSNQDVFENVTTSQIEPLETTIELYSLDDKTTFTGYSLSVDETDENPCVGAGNNNLCELRPILKEEGRTICASRDLPLDTVIYIDGIGECIIKDRMNKRYKGTNRVDILFDSKQEAINFGKQQLSYVII